MAFSMMGFFVEEFYMQKKAAGFSSLIVGLNSLMPDKYLKLASTLFFAWSFCLNS
jgi:hypothetical protein